MLQNETPKVEKLNKTVVVFFVLALAGLYIGFGLYNQKKKESFLNNNFYGDVEVKTRVDAPTFIKNKKSYADINLQFSGIGGDASDNNREKSEIKQTSITPNEKPEVSEQPLNGNSEQNQRNYKQRPVYIPSNQASGVHQDNTYSKKNIKDNSPMGWSYSNNNKNNNQSQAGEFDKLFTKLDDPEIKKTEDMLSGLMNAQGGSREKNHHKQFLENAEKRQEIYLAENIQKPKSPYQLMAGSIIPVTLISGINSDLPGEIVAQVPEQVYDTVTGNHLLIPHGTRFKGIYDSGVLFGQQRVLFAWDRILFPNGDSIQLRGMVGHDLSGYSGLTDTVDFHYMRLTGAILLSSFLATGTDALDNENTARSQMAKDINKSGQKIVDMQLNVKPTIKIRPGTKFNIMVKKDIILKPYKG